MQFNFALKYDDGVRKFDQLDHYYGAQSLFGMSQILMISFNAFFNKEVITQATAAKGFRVVLGVSKRGSWEQALQLIITDPAVIAYAQELGKDALYDLIKWALTTGVGATYVLKHRKSRKRVRELERANEDLHEKLDEALKRAHAPIKHQGLTLQVMSGRSVLATYDDMTLQYLETEVYDEETHQIPAAISRFNARTGTGRLISAIDSASVPFVPIDKLTKTQNTRLADSLAQLARDVFDPVELIVSKITDANGRIKRYRLHRVLLLP
jgi:hypothetical protein